VNGSSETRLALILGAVLMAILVVIAVPIVVARRSSVGLPLPQSSPLQTSSPTVMPSPTAPPSSAVAPPAAGCPTGLLVKDAAQLTHALAAVTPGSTIVMAPGTYSGRFVASVSGTASAPITLCGRRDSVIDGGPIKLGYSFYLQKVDWWRVIGFSVQGGQKGVVADHANHVLISRLYVHDVGDEGIHLREFSSDNIVEGNTVSNTGLLSTKFGEGIYVGSASSNWCTYTQCRPDNSDRNVIRNNDISHTTAENIDIKEGTSGGVIQGNRLSGGGMVPSAATAWINVKGNDWTIVGNVGRKSVKDGFQVHRVYNGWGSRNIFRANQAMVDGTGFGIYVQSSSLGTVVTCDNVASGAALGLSNIKCTAT
jgi:hypothetical protein